MQQGDTYIRVDVERLQSAASILDGACARSMQNCERFNEIMLTHTDAESLLAFSAAAAQLKASINTFSMHLKADAAALAEAAQLYELADETVAAALES